MRRTFICLFAFLVLIVVSYAIGADAPAQPAADKQAGKEPANWAMNATIIEACSCPMFCQCYFDTKPAAHSDKDPHAGHAGHEAAAAGAEHYCKFNNAYQVNKGNWGDVKLDGAKFWLGGDLGGDFSQGKMNWAALTFDPSVKPEQRDGIKAILGHVYPVTWNSFTVTEDKPVEWKAMKDKAEARLADGKAAEIVLKKNEGMSDEPIVIKNMRYWGAPRNDGFVLMQNDVEALRDVPQGQQPFEFKRTNGFMITFDIKSDDVKEGATKKKM